MEIFYLTNMTRHAIKANVVKAAKTKVISIVSSFLIMN